MDMRAEVWSPLQNTAVWLGAWLHGRETTDDLLQALRDVGGRHELLDGRPVTDLLAQLRSVADLGGEDPVLRLVLSGPGEAPALPAGSDAAQKAMGNGVGAIVVKGKDLISSHVLVPELAGPFTRWEWFTFTDPLPAPAWLSPGEADQLLAQATRQAADLIEGRGYRTDALNNPRLTVGALSDFYDTPGLPSAVPARAAKLFARADRVAAIVETVTARMGEHTLDPQLLSLWHHIRAARMAGVVYAVADFGRAI